MPRANRSLIPGHVWHITHRCHQKEFLLKFRRDKLLWMRWLLEAKRRFGPIVLNFMITSNHIHLVVFNTGSREGRGSGPAPAMPGAPRARDAHPVSMAIQLAHARVAQEYNRRKSRHGAFWEDRFHATAIECGAQLARCLTYVDMNMVRAGVVRHPRDWPFCGYGELRRPDLRPRLRLVDTDALAALFGARDRAALLAMRDDWIDQAMRKGRIGREPIWTESLAVGSEEFLMSVRGRLGAKLRTASIVGYVDPAGCHSFALHRSRRAFETPAAVPAAAPSGASTPATASVPHQHRGFGA